MEVFETLKIPQELYELAKDKVILTKEDHDVTPFLELKKVTEKVPSSINPARLISRTYYKESIGLRHKFKTEVFGIGLLNMIAMYTLDFGYTYLERQGDVFLFEEGASILRIDIGDKFTFSIDNGIREKEYSIKKTTNGVVSYVTAIYNTAQIATLLSAPESEVISWVNNLGWVWNGGKVDTTTNVANVFSIISEENGVVTADLLVNEKSFREYNFGSLVFPFGKSGQDFVVDWVLYNEHPTSTPPKWLSEGNFGEAGTVRISQKSDAKATTVNVQHGEVAGYDADTHTFTYNPTKQSIISFQPQLKPAQGKNDVYEVCLDLNTGNVYYSRIEALKKAKGLVLGA